MPWWYASTGSAGTVSAGIQGVIRHPWYTAAILIVRARPLDLAAIVTNAVLTTSLVIGTFLEERKLVVEFGEGYREYQRGVPMFVPGKRRGSALLRFLRQAHPFPSLLLHFSLLFMAFVRRRTLACGNFPLGKSAVFVVSAEKLEG